MDRDSYALVWWLRTLDGLSTLGVVREIPELRVAYDYLYDLVESKDLPYKQNDMSLKRFKDIASIEDGWKNEKNKFCDVFFLGLVHCIKPAMTLWICKQSGWAVQGVVQGGTGDGSLYHSLVQMIFK